MEEIRLDGAEMTDRAAVHAYLKIKLDLPDYYGNNLDALWDCLSTDFFPKRIIISNADAMVDNLGGYGEAIINVFREAYEENEHIYLIIEGHELKHLEEFMEED
ncbi:MAG: barstar family protein [Peptostreptococcaceae bacterium]|nr:barstar family protein [Peptostreptococcaceae bacterium]